MGPDEASHRLRGGVRPEVHIEKPGAKDLIFGEGLQIDPGCAA
jgi:hypothetical protein